MDILTLFACFSTFASNTSIGQVAVIANAMLSMTGRITMLSLSRWTGEGGSYRTILRFFATKLAWQELQVKFFRIFVERLWRTVKQEEVYLKEYADVWEAENCVGINDLKSQYRGIYYALETLKLVEPKAESNLIEKVIQAISRIGSIHRHHFSHSSA